MSTSSQQGAKFVRCRTGSSEITTLLGDIAQPVRCRTGSSEMIASTVGAAWAVRCRTGSSEKQGGLA